MYEFVAFRLTSEKILPLGGIEQITGQRAIKNQSPIL